VSTDAQPLAGSGEGLPGAAVSTTTQRDEDGKWKVDTGYIDHRTQDPNNLAPRRSDVATDAQPAGAGIGIPGTGVSATTQKDEAGKWKVDTSYIDRRTQDVNNLQPRRSFAAADDVVAAAPRGSTHSATTKKDEEGRWKVDTSYVKNKTQDTSLIREEEAVTEGRLSSFSATTKKDEEGKWKVDTSYVKNKTLDTSLIREDQATEGSRASFSATTKKDEEGKWKVDTSYVKGKTLDTSLLRDDKAESAASMGHSASVKKDGEGKWTVDTGYVQHRTGDVANLEKKAETTTTSNFADFEATKFSYQELIEEWAKEKQDRKLNLDPANREKYLSAAEFQTIFGIGLDELQKMPKWKRDKLKKEKNLF
jgi:hypothetical protein